MQIQMILFLTVELCTFFLIYILWRRLRFRSRELAALASHNIDIDGYGVPEPLVDKCTPVKVAIGESFILVDCMPLERLERFTRDYIRLIRLHLNQLGMVRFFLEGGKAVPENMVKELKNTKRFSRLIIKAIERAILRGDTTCNPNKINGRYLKKHLTADQLYRILFALYQYNAGEQFKKKLLMQQAAILGHMDMDLLGQSNTSGSNTTNTYVSPFADSPFYPANQQISQSGATPTKKGSLDKQPAS